MEMSELSAEALLGREAIEAVRQPIERGRGLGRAAYASEAFFRLEQDRVFRRGWIPVGFGHEVAQPGDAMPVVAGGMPLIVLRDRAGDVRAFHNVCRHRGSLILTEPAKQRPTLRCPYHGWAYGLDGALKATPLWDGKRVADPKSLDRENRGLVPVRCEAWHDVVFVDLSGEAEPLAQYVAPIAKLWEPYEMGEFHLAHYESGEVQANWKLAVEAAIENYHEEFVHQELPARIDKDGNKTFTDVFDGAMFGFTWSGDSSLRSSTPLVPMKPGVSSDSRVDNLCFLFPNVQMNLFGDVSLRTIWEPLSVGRTRWRSSWYLVGATASDDAHAEAREQMMTYWRQLRAEDAHVLGLMQQGRQSPIADDVKLSPFWEGSIRHFHNMVVDRVLSPAAA